MSKVKVLITAERFWPEGSGGELATYLITKILNRYFDVTVLTGTKYPKIINGVQYLILPALRGNMVKLWFEIIRHKRLIMRLIEKHDTVYIPRYSFPVALMAKKQKKNVIIHQHGFISISPIAAVPAPYEKYRHKILRKTIEMTYMRGLRQCINIPFFLWLPKLIQRWLLYADKILCVSYRQAEILIDVIPEIRNKVKVVYNPLPPVPDIEKKLTQTPVLLYMGGDNYIKGFHVFLEASKGLLERKYKVKFVLAGKYDEKAKSILKKLNRIYENSYIVLGKISHEEIFKLYRRAWALLFPSICEEPLPYVLFESMLSGTIPIAAKVGGVLEIINDSPAERFSFTLDNINKFIEHIEQVASMTHKEVIDVGFKLKDKVLKKFNPEIIEQELIEAFTSMK